MTTRRVPAISAKTSETDARIAEMLKGTRDAILKNIQPISIHGQVSWEIVFTHVDDPEEQLHAARVGPEAIVGHTLEAGDHVQIDYLVGVVVNVTRIGQIEK